MREINKQTDTEGWIQGIVMEGWKDEREKRIRTKGRKNR